jgi:pseudo-rSAM protein
MHKWLYLDPYAEITFNHSKKRCLIFNTLDSKKYLFEGKEYEMIKRISQSDYSTKITDNDEEEYKSLISKFEDNFFGGIYTSIDKPLILYPIINIQRNLRKFKQIPYRDQGTDILENLLEISIHFKNNNLIKIDKILQLIRDAENSSLKKINIFIDSYSSNKKAVEILLSFLKTAKIKTYIDINIKEYYSFINDLPDAKSNEIFSLLVTIADFDFSEKIMEEKNIRLKFKISNEEEYNYYFNKISKNIEYDFEIDYPNADANFLSENIYLNEEDIQDIKLTKQNYDANKMLNRNLFGKLVIKDNAIYNCENSTKAIANLDNEINLKQILFDALCKSNYWFFTRNNVMPCKACLYKNICPPITENELQIKKYNLCNVLAM